MLHKEVCQRCMEVHATDHHWLDCDERAWEFHGLNLCPVKLRIPTGINKWLNINNDVPDYCPYQLEHLVLSGGVVDR